MILIDSNILIDILGDYPEHCAWSQRELDRALINHQPAINPVVYAEISPPYATEAALDEVLAIMKITIEPMSTRALFLAGGRITLIDVAAAHKHVRGRIFSSARRRLHLMWRLLRVMFLGIGLIFRS